MRVKDRYPPRHNQVLVRRSGKFFTATPCYGTHEPWWVVLTMEGEVPPTPMLETDEWWSLASVDYALAQYADRFPEPMGQ